MKNPSMRGERARSETKAYRRNIMMVDGQLMVFIVVLLREVEHSEQRSWSVEA